MVDSPLLTREDMLAVLRVRSLTTLDAMIKAGEIPAPRRFGDSRRLFWHRATIDAFLTEKFGVTSQSGSAPAQSRSITRNREYSSQGRPRGMTPVRRQNTI
jgi:predicted DNA-binding transcriptional regulator AlpA